MLKATPEQINKLMRCEELIKQHKDNNYLWLITNKETECYTLSFEEPECKIVPHWMDMTLFLMEDVLQFFAKNEPSETPVYDEPELFTIDGYNGLWTFGCDVPNSESCIVFRQDESTHMVIPKERLIPYVKEEKEEPEYEVTTLPYLNRGVGIFFKGKKHAAVVIDAEELPEDLPSESILAAILKVLD